MLVSSIPRRSTLESVTIATSLILGLILVCSNAFFVMTEFALTRAPQFGRDQFEGHKGLEKAWRMTSELEIYLTGCQVGITFCSVLIGVVAEPGFTRIFEMLSGSLPLSRAQGTSVSVVLSVLVINLIHTIWAEQTPTYLGIEKSREILRWCAIPHYYWTKTVYPLILIGDRVSKATLRLFGVEMERSWNTKTAESFQESLLALLAGKGLTKDRQAEVVNAVEISDMSCREIMIERERMASLSTENAWETNLEIMRENLYDRYPLSSGNSAKDFLGVVHTPEVLARLPELETGEVSLKQLAHNPLVVSGDTVVSQLIDTLQRHRTELALVEDDKKVVGLLTLTDALEQIVGPSEDPLDQ